MKSLILLAVLAAQPGDSDLRTYTSDATCPCGAAGDCNCPNCPCPKVSVSNSAAEAVTVPKLISPKLTQQQKTDLLNDYDVYMDRADTASAQLTAKPKAKASQTQALSYQRKTKTLVYEPPLVEVKPTQQQYTYSYAQPAQQSYAQPMQAGGSAGGNLYAPPAVTYYQQAPQAAPSYGSSGGVPAQASYQTYYSPAPVQTYTANPSQQVYVNAAPAPAARFTPFGGFFRGGASGRMICSGGQCYIR